MRTIVRTAAGATVTTILRPPWQRIGTLTFAGLSIAAALWATYHLGVLFQTALGPICLAIGVSLFAGIGAWDLSRERD